MNSNENSARLPITFLRDLDRDNCVREIMYLLYGKIDYDRKDQVYIIIDELLRKPLYKRAIDIYNMQLEILKANKFSQYLGLSSDAYLNTLPQLAIPSKNVLLKFPIPVIVEPRIPLQIQTINMDNDFEPQSGINSLDRGFHVDPYIVWIQDNQHPSSTFIHEPMPLGENERFITFLEAVGLYRAAPWIFFLQRFPEAEIFGIMAGSSRDVDGAFPFLYHNYIIGQDVGEFQVMSINNTRINHGGWPTCWNE